MSSKRTYLVQYYRLGCVGIYRKEVLCLEYIHFCIWNVTAVVRQYVRDDIKSTKRIWGISPFSFGDLHKLHKNFSFFFTGSHQNLLCNCGKTKLHNLRNRCFMKQFIFQARWQILKVLSVLLLTLRSEI